MCSSCVASVLVYTECVFCAYALILYCFVGVVCYVSMYVCMYVCICVFDVCMHACSGGRGVVSGESKPMLSRYTISLLIVFVLYVGQRPCVLRLCCVDMYVYVLPCQNV